MPSATGHLSSRYRCCCLLVSGLLGRGLTRNQHLGHLLRAVRNVEGVYDGYRVTSGKNS